MANETINDDSRLDYSDAYPEECPTYAGSGVVYCSDGDNKVATWCATCKAGGKARGSVKSHFKHGKTGKVKF